MASSMSISVGAPQPYPSPSSSSKTYYNNNDYCNFGICSFNCPQLCFLPPPPPLFFNSDDSSPSSSHISPLMAALIAVLAAAFLLLFYFTVISKLCNNRRNNNNNNRRNFLDSETTDPLSSSRVDSLVHDPTRSDTGLDDAFIRQITVFKFKREDKLIDGVECSICLNEFNEDENLRLMPNCEHAFHLPCIDTWLKSHSNCPLCRSSMNLVAPPLRSSSTSNNNSGVAALTVQRTNDAVLVIQNLENRLQRVVEANQGQVEERETKLEINSNSNSNNNNNNNHNNNQNINLR